MGVALKSNVDENPKLLKRKNDKVRQLFDEEDDDKEDEKDIDTEDEDFELDVVNVHPCMLKILKVLDSLEQKFSEKWSDEEMPKWMKNLHGDYPALNKSAKLFVLKLIINRPEIFQPYANYWFEYLAEYAISKDTGGKGLHYFLRDICSVLIRFHGKYEIASDKNKRYCNEILNSLIKYAADKRRVIFAHNIQIISSLMENWRECIESLDEQVLSKMLTLKDAQMQNSDLWRMTAIQVIALSCRLGIKCDLLNDLLKQLENRKRSIIYSASEVIGVLLSNQPELLEDASNKIQALFSGEAKQDIFVNIIQKVSKYQGLFAIQKPIMRKLLSFLKPFSASFRARVLQSFQYSIVESKGTNEDKIIQEI